MLSFVNKLLGDNISYTGASHEYTIFLKIINNDGNLYDAITHMVNKMLTGDNKVNSLNLYRM
jgi:hypothetical protein